ncbi:MAG: hypothetical protein QG673_136 [Pseudomonadota bacterium]|nr:hypothetical protein [Pseudomonadota bacterium]
MIDIAVCELNWFIFAPQYLSLYSSDFQFCTVNAKLGCKVGVKSYRKSEIYS